MSKKKGRQKSQMNIRRYEEEKDHKSHIKTTKIFKVEVVNNEVESKARTVTKFNKKEICHL